jgi:ATP-dependent Clp protease protease subunit
MSEKKNEMWKNKLWETTKKTRTVLFSEDVTSQSVQSAMQQLLALEADDPKKLITLLLNSPGGSVDSGYAWVDVIRFMKPPLRVISMGLVASMGISILLAADKKQRFSLPNTRFMLHQPRYFDTVRGTASDLEITAIEMVKMKDKSNREISKATGQPLEKIEKDTARDLWLDAEEALKYGLVHQVITRVDELPAK